MQRWEAQGKEGAPQASSGFKRRKGQPCWEIEKNLCSLGFTHSKPGHPKCFQPSRLQQEKIQQCRRPWGGAGGVPGPALSLHIGTLRATGAVTSSHSHPLPLHVLCRPGTQP